MVSADMRPSGSMLKEIVLLQAFTEAELDELARAGVPQSVEPHANVVIEGEPTWGLYLVLEGLVGVYKTNKLSGDVYDVGQMRNGQFFGEMSLIDDNPRSATVRALTECHLFYVSKEAFHAFLDGGGPGGLQGPSRRIRFYEHCIKDLVGRLRELGENYIVSQYQLWRSAIHNKEAA